MKPHEFHDLYRELIEENPLAVRAVLKILAVEFTTDVPTLAVTCEGRPRLLVNLKFVSEHCRGPAEVKAVVCHEFLHVLLRHTERLTPSTRAEHIAFDAVINAIIHRSMGESASAMMSRYYANEKGVCRLLRPPTKDERSKAESARWSRSLPKRGSPRQVSQAWMGLYNGQLVADDIRELIEDLQSQMQQTRLLLIGDHDSDGAGVSAAADDVLAAALETSLKAMNGSGVFRSPKGRGLGAEAYAAEFRQADTAVERWRRQTYDVLRRHLVPDPRSAAREHASSDYTLPVLSSGDRRAALRARWSPLLPDARWNTAKPSRAGSAHVYLDVSGSMHAEMPHIVALLGRLSRCIRRPFWAFSTKVAPARIEQGRLIADTTGGTSMACVLEHVACTRPRAAVVVTDGYIEAVSRADAAAAVASTRLHVIVTRDGTTTPIAAARLPYTQLARFPNDPHK